MPDGFVGLLRAHNAMAKYTGHLPKVLGIVSIVGSIYMFNGKKEDISFYSEVIFVT